MIKLLSKSAIFSVLAILASACSAETDVAAPVTPTVVQEYSEIEQSILSKLQAARPDLTFTSIRPAADPALYEVEYNDGLVIYATASGNFFLVGDLFTFQNGQIINVSEQRKSEDRARIMANIPASEMISFGPSAEDAKAELYVFTDVDCGYCRKLHDEVGELNSYGIRVNYLAYPRAGIGSVVANKMQSAWCSSDPSEAMTLLKSGKSIPEKTCDSTAVAEQFEIGRRVGVSGTPALLTSDGLLIPGYRPAASLAAMLGVAEQ